MLVLAAGVGSRYGGLKQMDPVGPNGELIIDYSIYDALRAGFEKVVFLIRKDLDRDFREVIGDRIAKKTEVRYAYQELEDIPHGFNVSLDRTKPWGTAHAVWCAREAVSEPFITINADDFYGFSSYQILFDFLNGRSNKTTEYCLAGYVLRNTLTDFGHVARGVCKSDVSDYLESVVEHTRVFKLGDGARSEGLQETPIHLSGDEIVSMNMFGFTPSIVPYLEGFIARFFEERGKETKSEALLPTAVDEMIRNSLARVSVLHSKERWFGVTYQEDRPAMIESIRTLIETGEYPEVLWS